MVVWFDAINSNFQLEDLPLINKFVLKHWRHVWTDLYDLEYNYHENQY